MGPEMMSARSHETARSEGEDPSGSRRFLATLIGNLPGMVYRCENDPRWPFSFVSQGCLELTGWASDDFVTRRVDYGEVILAEDRKRIWEEVQVAVALRQPFLLTYRIRTRDGTERWVWEKGCGVFDEHDRLEALEGVILDISQQKALEGQLLEASKLEAVGQLAGGVAHDFNNLLTAILGYSDMLAAQLPAGSEPQRHATRILQAAQRAADLTRRLLSFSRKQPAEPRVFDLSELVLSIDPMLRRLVGEDIELVTLLGHEAVPVEADPAQVEQVLVHLVVNARQAMPAGGKLTIEVERAVGAEPSAVLSVSDTGSGEGGKGPTHVTEPRDAQDAAESLGLVVCREIVERASGRLEMDGERERGSCFRVRLPLTRPTRAATLVSERREPVRRGRETLLLVEDEPLVRQVALEALEGLGYRVLVARTGGEALEIARRSDVRIDALVTDLVLPLMSGAEVARRLLELQPGARVLIVSGYGEPRQLDQEEGLEQATFLAKPFTPRSLGAALQRVLEPRVPGGERRSG